MRYTTVQQPKRNDSTVRSPASSQPRNPPPLSSFSFQFVMRKYHIHQKHKTTQRGRTTHLGVVEKSSFHLHNHFTKGFHLLQAFLGKVTVAKQRIHSLVQVLDNSKPGTKSLNVASFLRRPQVHARQSEKREEDTGRIKGDCSC